MRQNILLVALSALTVATAQSQNFTYVEFCAGLMNMQF